MAVSALPEKEHSFIIEDNQGRKEIVLTEATYSIGRAKNCNIKLRSQFVSRHHATLFRCLKADGESYYRIVDGDGYEKQSVNGILINGQKMSIYDLKDGDEIVFGPQVFGIYKYRQRDKFPTLPCDDPYDITLIDPAMAEIDEEPTNSLNS
jgi:pSer/pThr/pTyr-binding forkhead associated (FHA) protein